MQQTLQRVAAIVLEIALAVLLAGAVWVKFFAPSRAPDPPPDPVPTAVITGQTKANAGDLVVLDASNSVNATGYAWVLAGSEKAFFTVEQGMRVVFASGTPGEYNFVLVAANASKDGVPAVSTDTHTLTVGDPGPGPGPGPGPTPPPAPLPPGRFGLAQTAFTAASSLGLPAADLKRGATGLANSYNGTASAIAAGALKTIADAQAALVIANRAAVGVDLEKWRPFGARIEAEFSRLDQAGQIKTVADVADAYKEIATGLAAIP